MTCMTLVGENLHRFDTDPNSMIISCPECTARFQIEAAALGATGRMVRCGKCAHTWPVTPLETISEGIDLSADNAASLEDPRIGAEEGIDPDPPFDPNFGPDRNREQEAAEQSANRTSRRGGAPTSRRNPKSIVAQATWAVLIMLVIGVAGGVSLQDLVIETWPEAEPIYARLGMNKEPLGVGFNLVNVQFIPQSDGSEKLLVQGELENSSDRVMDVPGLRATLFNKNEKILHRTLFRAPLPRLLPGEIVKFSTIIKSGTKGALRGEVDFHEPKPK